MKKIISLVLILGVLAVFLSAQTADQPEYKKFYRLGLAPLIKGGIHSVEEVRLRFCKKMTPTKENQAVHLLLGDEKIAKAFFEQIEYTEIESVILAAGQRFEKMAFYSNGSVKLTGKVEWGGPRIFRAFSFSIHFENKVFWFVIPNECGNLCVSNIEIFLVPEKEKVIEEDLPQEIFTSPPQRQKRSVPAVTEPEPKKIKKAEYLIDVFISEFQGCGNEYAGARIGIQYPKGGNLKVFATSGAASPILSRDGKWKSILLLDAGAMVKMGRVHFGAGVGFSTNIREEKDDQLEGMINTGLQILKNVNLFFEGRAPFSEEREGNLARNHRKFLAGIRVTF